MKQRLFLNLLIFLIILGCSRKKDRLDIDVADISIAPVKIHRYDLDLFKVNPRQLKSELMALKPEYPFFLGTDLNDTAKLDGMLQYLENPGNREFYTAVSAKYQNLEKIENQLTDAFRHFIHYIPGFRVPRVYAYISGGDYEYPAQFADSVLLIGFDNYLGTNFKPYIGDGLPAYRIARMNEESILPDCVDALVKAMYPAQLPGNNLLEQIIEAGKRLYLMNAMIPGVAGRLRIGYTKEQCDWIGKNEKHVWAAIISNRMLYTTDSKLIRSFMADGPFTAEFSKDSPPRLGEWIGWQIVTGYMENQPEVTFEALINEKDAQKILSQSGYKPGD
ncbi:MAG: hypothetical protein NT004_14505 [Bacteroidetes bacterium]|nr:hypothetical protein [Bacteroidota bacterium]